ncbi:hypothetical protein DF16_orf05756 [Bacillus thuringiensis serovar kurstaki str. YBT-1520]|nr:hypothetical protein DF16_orf05756 [Bacillus thuringiensis serovar kurstaki str. YBT-1520]
MKQGFIAFHNKKGCSLSIFFYEKNKFLLQSENAFIKIDL